METNDGNIKPQQTGGLKLMTVFIAVLALHVVVIGGFTVYHLMSGGNTDADITLDKSHLKPDATATTDSTAPDVNKPATTDVASSPATTTPAPDNTASTSDVAAAPIQPPVQKPAPTTSVTTTSPVKPAAPATSNPPMTMASAPPLVQPFTTPAPSTTIPSLAPPPEPTLSLAAPAPVTPLLMTPIASAPVASGPVHMPAPAASTPAASTHDNASVAAHKSAPAPVSDVAAKKATYTVKITDSYKKIAKEHHITVAQLKEANHIKDNTLHAGQKLVIPGAGKSAVAKSDEVSAMTVADTSTATTSHHKTYTVEKGDTLAYIAKKFKTTKSALIAANDISNPSKLTPGKKLKIPASKESHSTASVAPVAQPVPVQVQTQQPAPVAQPVQAPQPMATQPTSPQPVITPELANMTF